MKAVIKAAIRLPQDWREGCHKAAIRLPLVLPCRLCFPYHESCAHSCMCVCLWTWPHGHFANDESALAASLNLHWSHHSICPITQSALAASLCALRTHTPFSAQSPCIPKPKCVPACYVRSGHQVLQAGRAAGLLPDTAAAEAATAAGEGPSAGQAKGGAPREAAAAAASGAAEAAAHGAGESDMKTRARAKQVGCEGVGEGHGRSEGSLTAG